MKFAAAALAALIAVALAAASTEAALTLAIDAAYCAQTNGTMDCECIQNAANALVSDNTTANGGEPAQLMLGAGTWDCTNAAITIPSYADGFVLTATDPSGPSVVITGGDFDGPSAMIVAGNADTAFHLTNVALVNRAGVCVLAGEAIPSFVVSGATFENCTAGAVASLCADTSFIDSVCRTNRGSLGACLNVDVANAGSATTSVTVEGSYFFGNDASQRGGAVRVLSVDEVSISSSVFMNSTGDDEGSHLSLEGCVNVSISDSTFTNAIGGDSAISVTGETTVSGVVVSDGLFSASPNGNLVGPTFFNSTLADVYTAECDLIIGDDKVVVKGNIELTRDLTFLPGASVEVQGSGINTVDGFIGDVVGVGQLRLTNDGETYYDENHVNASIKVLGTHTFHYPGPDMTFNGYAYIRATLAPIDDVGASLTFSGGNSHSLGAEWTGSVQVDAGARLEIDEATITGNINVEGTLAAGLATASVVGDVLFVQDSTLEIDLRAFEDPDGDFVAPTVSGTATFLGVGMLKFDPETIPAGGVTFVEYGERSGAISEFTFEVPTGSNTSDCDVNFGETEAVLECGLSLSAGVSLAPLAALALAALVATVFSF